MLIHGDGFLAGVPVIRHTVGTVEGVQSRRWSARYPRSSGSSDGHQAADQSAAVGSPGAGEWTACRRDLPSPQGERRGSSDCCSGRIEKRNAAGTGRSRPAG